MGPQPSRPRDQCRRSYFWRTQGDKHQNTRQLSDSLQVCAMQLTLGEVGHVSVVGCWANSLAGPTTSFLVSGDGIRLLLDVGCDPVGSLRRLDVKPTDIDAIYISHLHSDHASGLANFIFTRGLLSRTEYPRTSSVMVLCQQEVLTGAAELVRIQYPERQLAVKWIPLEPMKKVKVTDSCAITIFESLHTVPCYGAIIGIGGVSVGFTSDTSPSPDHREVLADCNVLIGEAFGLAADVGRDVHKRGHSTAEDLAALAAATRCEAVIPFHFGPEYRDYEKRRTLLAACSEGHDAIVVDPVGDQRASI